MKILPDMGITFDDVILVPQFSDINSRFDNEIDLSVKLLPGCTLTTPIVSANMDTITGPNLAQKMAQLEGLGIIHRFMDFDTHKNSLEALQGTFRIGCIGVGKEGLNRAEAIVDSCEAFLIDIAHGHSLGMINQIKAIKELYPNKPIIAGNVATYEGAKDLIAAGIDCIKCGVGSGGVCVTRVNTGNGVPQLTAIAEVRRAISKVCSPVTLIADGGIKNSGEIVKSIAAGADVAMLGSLLAGTDEAIGEKFINNDGKMVKYFRGMASIDAQKDWKGYVSSEEGEATWVPYKGPVEEVITKLRAGILSGFSYQGSRNIKQLQEKAIFMRQTLAGFQEGLPHAKK